MLIETLIITMFILFIIKKNMKWLNDLKFDYIVIVFTAFFIESILNIGSNFGTRSMIEWIVEYTLYFHMGIYILLFIFVWKNIKIRGMWIIGLGFLLNFIVIIANKGFMPVDITMGIKYNFEHTLYDLQYQHLFGHNILTQMSKFNILADTINIPPPYFWPKTISIGDLFIDLGLITLLCSICFSDKKYFSKKSF